MVDLEAAREICLSLPESEEYDHFGKPAYRVRKKIFATLSLDDKRAVVKLSKEEQPQWCEELYPAVFPVKNKWGQLGWTYVELSKVSEGALRKLIRAAWTTVAPKTLVKKAQ